MTAAAQPLYFARAVRALERAAMDDGLSGAELMQRAGASVFTVISRRYSARRPVAVLCGGGNNGGDGYVIARLAAQNGYPVRVFAATAPHSEESIAQKSSATAAGVSVAPLADFTPDADTLIVDALLGTGIARDVDAAAAQLFTRIAQAGADVIAVDVPSGLCCDSGKIYGGVLVADVTVTFIAHKPGLFTGRGAAVVGDVVLDTLGIADEVYASVAADANLLSDAHLKSILRPRAADMHKHAAGHALVVGGGVGMNGAAVMAAEGALRAGAGLVTLCTEGGAPGARPEVMSVAAADLRAAVGGCSVAVVGPGLGVGAFAVDALAVLLERDAPMVVDADALNLLAREPLRRDDWVLTPHPGEAARLLSTSTADVQADRIAAAIAIAGRYGGVCVLKGAGSVVTDGNQTWLCAAGNAGMAAAGMGDVLAGVIGAFIAQGYGAMDSACCGVQLHAAAGDAVAAVDGAVGMAATDVPPMVRRLHNRLLEAVQ